MASLPAHAHRRRSLSASTSSPRSRSSTDWTLPTKRAYPSHFVHDAYFAQPLDSDTWRQKKRRRDHSPPLDSTHAPPSVLVDWHNSTMSATPSFASTPAEFHLFPKSVYDAQRPCGSTPTLDSFSFGFSASESHDLATLSNLRSNAFGELHRTVAENGEGLIQRMRDYELSRSKSDVYPKVAKYPRRGRKQSSRLVVSQKTLSERRQLINDEDDDEDVQILLPQRAVSLGPGDFSSPFAGSNRCSSPVPYPSAIYQSDGELHMSSGRSSSAAHSLISSPHQLATSSTPALSHSLSNSTNSSLVSLALPPPVPCHWHQASRPAPASTRSEKAIAALALAMASGAGGLTDYEALVAIQTTPAPDNSQVGEMWH